MTIKLQKSELFHTPANADEVDRWINRHSDPVERAHLYTLWGMVNNLIADTIDKAQQGDQDG